MYVQDIENWFYVVISAYSFCLSVTADGGAEADRRPGRLLDDVLTLGTREHAHMYTVLSIDVVAYNSTA